MLVVKDELSLEKLERLKDKIKKMRIAGLETGGEFSTENLAFKLLRRRGELNTLVCPYAASQGHRTLVRRGYGVVEKETQKGQ